MLSATLYTPHFLVVVHLVIEMIVLIIVCVGGSYLLPREIGEPCSLPRVLDGILSHGLLGINNPIDNVTTSAIWSRLVGILNKDPIVVLLLHFALERLVISDQPAE